MAYETYSCVNLKCVMYSKQEAGNISRRCMYGKEKDRELLYCRVCKKKFSAEKQTIFKNIRLPKRIVYLILENLCSGAGIRGTERNVGVHRDTVSRVLKHAANHFEEINNVLLKNIKVTEVQLDEFWSYVKKKKKMLQRKKKKIK